MRDNIRKPGARHLRVAATALAAAALLAAAAPKQRHECVASHSIWGEDDDPTQELSTEQMEVALARDIDKPLVVDVRSYEEYAQSHLPGAVSVAPRPGLSTSGAASEVSEIGKVLHGNIDAPIVLYGDGPFSGRNNRVAADLRNAGYTHIVRYQLGIPVWRALGHPTQSERGAIQATLAADRTAVVIDTRDPESFHSATLPGARNIRYDEVGKAKDDGRLPMLDHNTRIFVVGKDGAQAFATAQEIARNAFQNVSYCADSIAALLRAPEGIGHRP